MVEQIGNSNSSSPLERGRVFRGSSSSSAAPSLESALAGLGEDLQSIEHAQLSGEERARFNALAARIDNTLRDVSRQQTIQNTGSKLSDILGRIDELANEFDGADPDSDVGAAQRNSFAIEKINLQQALEKGNFLRESLFQPSAALDIVLGAYDLGAVNGSAAAARDAVDAHVSAAAEALSEQESKLAHAQVEFQNLQAAGAATDLPELAGQIGQLLRDPQANLLNLDRQNILSILGDAATD